MDGKVHLVPRIKIGIKEPTVLCGFLILWKKDGEAQKRKAASAFLARRWAAQIAESLGTEVAEHFVAV